MNTTDLSMERLMDVALWRGLQHELSLSPRELDVAMLLVLGYTVSQIAGRLHIARGTVLTYLERLRTKTGARQRAQLVVRLLLASGLILTE